MPVQDPAAAGLPELYALKRTRIWQVSNQIVGLKKVQEEEDDIADGQSAATFLRPSLP